MSEYNFSKEINMPFNEALDVVTQALKDEGFGVLTEIDVKETMKKKLNVDFPNYKILGACNPPFAYKALTAEIEIGTFLPCNVVVYERDSKIMLAVMKPSAAMGMVKNPALQEIALQVENKLKHLFDSVN